MIYNTTHNTTKNETNITIENHDVIFKELQLTLIIVVLVTGAILNTALILLFAKKRRGGARYNLLLNLAVSNWIACAFILPRLIVSLLLAPQKGVQLPCNVLLSVDELWWITQNWTLMAISYERYKKVSNPYHYPRRSYQFIIFIWLLAITAVLVLLLTTVVTYGYDKRIFRCRKFWEFRASYMFVHSFMSFGIPGFFLVYFNAYMMYTSYKAKRNEPRPFGTGSTMQRSWSVSSLASLRDFINTVHTRRRLSRSESLPTSLDIGRLEREVSASLSGRLSNSEGSDYSGKLSQRKKSLTSSRFKPLISTLLIVVPYLTACITNAILIYLYSKPLFVSNQKIDLLHKTKYILVAYFPYVFGCRDKEIKKELRKLYRLIRCWKSSEISPSPNIDSSDYPENVFRRDSRRSSMISRRSSMLVSDEPHSLVQSPYYGKDKNNTSSNSRVKGPVVSTCRDPSQIFYINSAINMPAVNC